MYRIVVLVLVLVGISRTNDRMLQKKFVFRVPDPTMVCPGAIASLQVLLRRAPLIISSNRVPPVAAVAARTPPLPSSFLRQLVTVPCPPRLPGTPTPILSLSSSISLVAILSPPGTGTTLVDFRLRVPYANNDKVAKTRSNAPSTNDHLPPRPA